MRSISYNQIFLWLAIYFLLSVGYLFINWLEFKQNDEKKERFLALPLKFKLVCAFILMPLVATWVFGFFINSEILKFLWIPNIIFYFIFQNKVIDWYKENSYWG